MSAQPPTDPTPSGDPFRPLPGSPDTSGPYVPPPTGTAPPVPPQGPQPTTPVSYGVPAQPERPRRRWGQIAVGAAAAIVVALAFAFLRGSDSMPSTDKWTTFADPGGRFTVAMPNTPERTTQQAPAGNVSLEVVTFTANYGDVAVGVAHTDYPPGLELGAPQDVLTGAVQGAAQGTQGTVVSSSSTTVAGRPAMDAEVQSSKGRALSRIILDGRRLYILTTAAKESRSDIQRYLTESLKLTP
ncbi:MAG: hypothetical protein H0W07_03780 [Chloroflexi bacterium]|nr:hypothetical protein [Chloroflexota bacterium]